MDVVPAFNSTERRIDLTVKVGLSEAELVNSIESTKAEFDLALRISSPDGELSPPSIHRLALTARAEEKKRALQAGLTAHLKIPVENSGFYRISVAVQSKQTGELGSTNSLIQAVTSNRKKQ